MQRISEEKKLPESIRLADCQHERQCAGVGKERSSLRSEAKKQAERKNRPEPRMSEETRAKFQQVMRNLQGKV